MSKFDELYENAIGDDGVVLTKVVKTALKNTYTIEIKAADDGLYNIWVNYTNYFAPKSKRKDPKRLMQFGIDKIIPAREEVFLKQRDREKDSLSDMDARQAERYFKQNKKRGF
jgi:hypothetical protein